MPGVITGLSCLLVTYVFLRFLQRHTHDAKEPPILASAIPFLSPLIGMAKQTKFYTELRDKYNLPIYTLRLPGSRIYVVNSVKLIAAVQHQVRVLDFAPIEARAAINVMGASPAGKELLNMNRNGVGEHSFAIEFSKAIHPAMSPGASLDALNRLSVQNVSKVLDELASGAPKTIKLYDWVREEVALATSDAVYGPANPFRDPKILAAFWKFEPGIVILLLQVLPSLLAKESLQAREEVAKAFMKYFDSVAHEQGSALIRARYEHGIDYGASLEDIARFEVGGAVAVLTNTIPTAFWVLWHFISDGLALQKCRHELLQLCDVSQDTVTIDITEVKHRCPIMVSTLQEVLRFHGMGTSVRVVQQDHLLDGEYLLKKGSTLMMPGPVVHTSKAIYGENVHQFQHDRFVRDGGKRLNPAGFRGFGGGSTLCPGRHFASTEIIAFVALAILRFDFKSVDNIWVRPSTDKAGMQATVPPPDIDIEVQVTLRQNEWVGKRWNPILNTSDKTMELAAEDAIKT